MPGIFKVCVVEQFEVRRPRGKEPHVFGLVLESGESEPVGVYCHFPEEQVAKDLLPLPLRKKVKLAKGTMKGRNLSLTKESKVSLAVTAKEEGQASQGHNEGSKPIPNEGIQGIYFEVFVFYVFSVLCV